MNTNKSHPHLPSRAPALLACFLVLVISATPAYAGGVINTSSGGVAIGGYDPVAYFTMEKAVKGLKEFTHEWLGTTWHFKSAQHRDMFTDNPIMYAPQHGGFCSVGVLDGGQYSVDPQAWRVVDGKLYLFYDNPTKSSWNPNRPAVAIADEDWLKTLLDLTQ